jgi:hypothetical protein
MKVNTLKYLISIIFIIGILGAGNLAYNEFLEEGTCPKLSIIPACYVILACFVFPFIAHLFNKGKIIYFLFTGFALSLATYATIGQLLGEIQCPKTEGGLPMCYISFVIFASLVLLKIISLKKKT